MRKLFAGLLLGIGLLGAVAPEAANFQRKIQLIQRDRVPSGSRVTLHESELNAFVRSELSSVVSDGIRDPRVKLGSNRATGYAYIDFPKLRRAQGKPLNWMMEKLLAGERPVQIDARIRSGNGMATVDVERVAISGIEVSGGTLDYLIRKFLWSYYPEAKVGQPFELAHRIERVEVQPSAVNVVIGK